MSWVKRNLYFVIGIFIAVVSVVAGGYYLYTQVAAESTLREKINAQYEELKKLINLNPHPGYGNINNIQAAKAETAAIKAWIGKTGPYFQRIPTIPESTNKISDADFSAALRVTINELHHSAEQQSVTIPKDYYFSFEAEKTSLTFDSTNLPKLAVELGEVKAISELLFQAKVNSLDYIRREAVSTDDKNQSDYLVLKSLVTPLAEMTPYEVKFRCFSAELSQVLANFANSPCGFIVKTLNVEPTSATTEENQNNPMTSAQQPVPVQPVYPNLPIGARPGGRGSAPMLNQTVYPLPVRPAAPTGKPQGFLGEKPFTLTMRIDVVKLKPLPAK